MDTEAQKTKTRKEKNLVLEWVENADTSINPC